MQTTRGANPTGWALSGLACAAIALFTSGALGQGVRFPSDARVINAATYGAVPNDGIDDTAAINAALNAPRPSGSNAKTVYLADGVYEISNTILWPDSRIVLQGQSQTGTVLRLRDNLPAFGNPATPKNVVSTREAGGFSANEFRNSIFDLTIDTGVGNPGAIGLRLHQNNQGGLRNVTIRSSDPARVGVRGLDLAGSDRGPGMIRNVTIEGFDEGVYVAGTEYSMVFDGLTLRHQRVVGIFNLWNILAIRNLTSENSVPAIRNVVDDTNSFQWGMIVLIDAVLSGGSPTQSAIFNQSRLYLRNVTASGYGSVLSENGTLVSGLTISEYANPRFFSVFQSPKASLNLVVEDTPEVPWDDPANLPGNPLGWWANVEAFGANGSDTADDSAAIQAAIDSGATTVYLPAGRYFLGQTVQIRGAVRRLIGVESSIEAAAPLSTTTDALFVIDDAGTAPIVVLERFSMNAGPTATGVEHASTRTLVLRNAGMGSYRGSGGGKLFQEDIVGGPWSFFAGQRAWLRQVNPENPGVKIDNNGADVWILGLKTEKPGTPISTSGGGRTELLGGLIYPVNALPLEEPMFINDESSFSAVIGESAYGGDAFHRVIVEETRGGELRRLWFGEIPRRVGFGYGAALSAYSGYVDPSPPPVVGPVGHWPLDAGSGTVAADVSGNGYDGIVSGADWTAGIAGNALNFDGADFADLPENMVTTSAGAIALWVRTSHNYTDIGHIFYGTDTTDGFANGGGSQNELHLNFRADDGVSFFIEGGAADVNLGTSGPINNGQWRFLVASWDRNGFNDLYLDGQRVGANTADGNVFGLSARTWWGRPNAAGRRFFGLLDDVRLYNRPLEHWEVLERYNATIGFANYPPAVAAGPDLTVQNTSYARALEGQAVDDGQPFGTFTVQWTTQSGPGAVSFADPSDPATTATFPQAGTYVLRLTASDGVATVFDELTATVFDPLPSPWVNVDVGEVAADGWAVFTPPAAFEVNGSGVTIAGNPFTGGDSFHFVYQPINAFDNIQIKARVLSIENTGADARAGVMFRQDVTNSATANALLAITPDGRLLYQARSGAFGGTDIATVATGVTPPVWLRLRRLNANSVVGAYSADGAAWTELSPQVVNVGGGTRYMGLAVCANSDTVNTSQFEHVAVIIRRAADADCNGAIDFFDIDPFLLALFDPAGYAAAQPTCDLGNADVNGDGTVDFFDIDPFLSCLFESCP